METSTRAFHFPIAFPITFCTTERVALLFAVLVFLPVPLDELGALEAFWKHCDKGSGEEEPRDVLDPSEIAAIIVPPLARLPRIGTTVLFLLCGGRLEMTGDAASAEPSGVLKLETTVPLRVRRNVEEILEGTARTMFAADVMVPLRVRRAADELPLLASPSSCATCCTPTLATAESRDFAREDRR